MSSFFPGDRPDPTILPYRGGFLLTHSSFRYAPGLPIYHSTDLLNWSFVAHALPDGHGDVWAPDLIEHNDKLWIYYKTTGGNFVVTADEPAGRWSAPVHIDLPGIDPGHVVDDAGQRYLHVSGGRAAAVAADGVTPHSEVKTVYPGWPIPMDWRVESVCLEGPKFVKRGGWYHMFAAEGGTAGCATAHMVVHARSKHPMGPYENSPHNPIVHTESRADRWHCRGHGTVFEGPGGQWWMVYHAYENGLRTLGRQPLLSPCQWTADDWLLVDQETTLPAPAPGPWLDNFDGRELRPRWQWFDGKARDAWSLDGEGVSITAEGDHLGNSRPLTTLAMDPVYEIEVTVDPEPGAVAGLALFYHEDANAGVGIGDGRIHLYRGGVGRAVGEPLPPGPVAIRMLNDRNEVELSVKPTGQDWRRLRWSWNLEGLHHDTFGGFLSLRPAIFCTGQAAATFNQFSYTPRRG